MNEKDDVAIFKARQMKKLERLEREVAKVKRIIQALGTVHVRTTGHKHPRNTYSKNSEEMIQGALKFVGKAIYYRDVNPIVLQRYGVSLPYGTIAAGCAALVKNPKSNVHRVSLGVYLYEEKKP